MIQFSLVTYWALMLALVLVCIFRWRHFGRSDRWLGGLMVLTVFQELIAHFMAVRLHDNLSSYHFYSPIELAFTGLYLVEATPSLRRRKLAVPIVALALGCGVINTLFFQPLTAFNSYYLLFESVAIILLSLWSLYKLMLMAEDRPVQRVQFWILVLLLYYWSTTFMSWGMYNVMHASRPWLLKTVFATVLSISNLVFYSGVVWTFIRYKRLIPSGA